jgi:hypothetical protein
MGVRGRRAALVVMIGAGLLLAPEPAGAATTIGVDNLAWDDLISPGPLFVAGHADSPGPGEGVRVFFDGRELALAPVDAAGRWSTTIDTGPAGDGVHSVTTDVPSFYGGTIGSHTALLVDQDPDDIRITSPAPDTAITEIATDGLHVSGRVAQPELVDRVFPYVDQREQTTLGVPVAADGTFALTIPTRLLPAGRQRLAIIADCGLPPRCRSMGTVPVTVALPSAATITTPTAGQAISTGTVMSFGVQVDNPGPHDSITGTVDGAIPLPFGGARTVSPTRGLYWANLGFPHDLREGRHTMLVTATLRDGVRALAEVPFVIDFTVPEWPRVTVAAATQVASSVAVSWAATDNVGVAGYDVRYRTSSATSKLGSYVYPPALQRTASTGTALPATAGATYCFSVRARDAADHLTGWTADDCTVTPYDDRWATASKGAKARTGPDYYRGTATTLTSRGTATRAGVTASHVGVVAQGCPSCGVVDVTLGGVKLGQVNLSLYQKTARVTAWLPINRTRTGALVITSRGQGPVTLDGILVRR